MPLAAHTMSLVLRSRRAGALLVRYAYQVIIRIPVVRGAASRVAARRRHGARSDSWYRDPRNEVILDNLARLDSELARLKARMDRLERAEDL